MATLLTLHLQLLAEGGEGGTGVNGGDAGSQTGVAGEPAAPDSGVQTAENLDAEFEELIKGKYKSQYQANMSKAIRGRVGEVNAAQERMSKLDAALKFKAKQYGVDENDADALAAAMLDDDPGLEDEAIERGLSLEELKAERKQKRQMEATKSENETLRNQIAQQRQSAEMERIHAKWDAEVAMLKEAYPEFDMAKELENPEFAEKMQKNGSVLDAYFLAHREESIGKAMQYAAQRTAAKVAASVAAGKSRPIENGIGAQAAVSTTANVNSMSSAEFRDYERRILNGERISFS